ncbi:uncharacterized protein [Amphiura filiformis]|uniref:uncharacterized protein n=1 Tax=Amphiura filiformis TaxID=82378 RepID=UPI003B20ED78
MTSSATKMSRQGAIWGSFIGNALAMPVHWYYNPDDIKQGYNGWLSGYVAPNQRHPTSILSISAAGSAGRSTFKGQSEKPVIGSVILHDKLKYWQSNDRTVHYHQGMAPGDNTLNSRLAAQTARLLSEADPSKSEDDLVTDVMTRYVEFMTTPGSHNDTYAESADREFFRDWQLAGSPKSPKDIMEFVEKRIKRLNSNKLDHNIDCIGALVTSTPVILHYAGHTEDVAAKNAVRIVRATHCSKSLDPYVELYARSLHAVVNGAKLKDVAESALSSNLLGGASILKRAEKFAKEAAGYTAGSEDRLRVYQDAISTFGMACYIDGSLPSMFFLAREFHDDFEGGVLTNANCGGENAHRGAILGSLLGAESGRAGRQIPQRFIDGLHSSKEDILAVLDNWNSNI